MTQDTSPLNLDTLKSEIEQVWPLVCVPDHPELGITYFARGGRGITGGRASSVEHLVRIASNLNNNGFNVYVNANPTRGCSIKGRAEDVTHWRNIVVDLDPVDGSSPDYGTILARLHGTIGASYCTTLDSGRGRQIWVAVEPVEVDARHTRQAIEQYQRRMLWNLNELLSRSLSGCLVDSSCSDLSRVVRLPGTRNIKTGNVARLIGLAEESMGVSTERLMSEYVEKSGCSTVVEQAPQRQPSSLIAILGHVTETAATFLIQGAQTSRHKSAYAAAASLAEIGVPRSDTMTLLRKGYSKSLRGDGFTWDDVVRAADNAYRRIENERST